MPSPFSFTNTANVGKAALVTSNTITPIGYDSIAEVSCTNGAQVSVGGGAWTSLITYISPGQTIAVRMTAANAWATPKSTTVSIGGRSTTWTVTTGTASAGVWDTGWTYGSWNVATPAFFNWFRVQLWAPAGGGGGGAGGNNGSISPGGNGSTGAGAGIARFNNGPYASGGGGGGGGGNLGATGSGGAHGAGVGGDTNTYAGGAAGGGGGAGGAGANYGGNGGPGGYGGYMLKTYLWGQITPSALCPVLLQTPGGGGAGGPGGGGAGSGSPGAGGGYGRAYIDWG